MSISLILYGILAIAVMAGAAAMFRAFNGPKVEKEKTAQEIEDTRQKEEQTKQQKQRQDTRKDILDKRLSWREKLLQWRNERRAGRRG